jgi:rhomboid protease GluP
MVLVYTAGSVCGFLLSSVLGLLPLPLFGSQVTVGASAAIFGFLGALVHYGRRSGSSHIGQAGLQYALIMGVLGFIPLFGMRVDNAAHLGGFIGGYLASAILDPHKPERVDHIVLALGCLVATLLAIVYTVVSAMPYLRS